MATQVPIQNNFPESFLKNKKLSKPTQTGARLAKRVEIVADILKREKFQTAISAPKTTPPTKATIKSFRPIFRFPFAIQYGARNSHAIKMR